MSGLSLVSVLYLLVPGFIADTLFRTVRGLEKGEEMERVLRSLVWSVFGLSVYLLFSGAAPEYLTELGTPDAAPSFSRINLLQLGAHTLFALAIAGAAAALLETQKIREAIQSIFRRTLGERLPWDFMWLEHSAGRLVRVVRKDGPTYWGYLRSASTGSTDKELLLRDASIEEDGQPLKHIENSRLLYIPGSEIAEIRLSPTQEEADAARR